MSGKKRVLIITYYWPPAGGIGVLRCLKIAKYLREFGWEPIVYTAKNAQYPVFDYGNLSLVPPGIEVIKYPIIEPFNVYKLVTGRKKEDPLVNVLNSNQKKPGLLHHFAVWIRSNFFIPDARALWIKPSVRFLLNYLKTNPVDAIFTDGPPHTNTMIANNLKEITGLPWLADFQDPWTQVDYYQLLKLTKWADKKHRKMEQKVFKNADKITIVSPSWKEDLEAIGAKDVSVIPWGYDEDDFIDVSPRLSEKFLISHTGLLGNDRTPDLLFRAVAELSQEITGFAEDVEIKLVGAVDFSVKETIKKYGCSRFVSVDNQIPRKEALELIQMSQVVLLLLNKADNVKGRIPGKLFEYLRSGRPILCMGPKGTDVENIIKEVNAGISVPYEDLIGLKNALKTLYFKYQNKELENNTIAIDKYSIKNLTGQIAGFLNEITLKK